METCFPPAEPVSLPGKMLTSAGLSRLSILSVALGVECLILVVPILSRGRHWLCDLHQRRRRMAEMRDAHKGLSQQEGTP